VGSHRARLTQRITALNAFLRDVYSDAKSSPTASCRASWSTVASTTAARCALQVPRNVYIAVVGSDLLRLNTGEFVVLEDTSAYPPASATC